MHPAVVEWTEATTAVVPIIISVPHSGTFIPKTIAATMHEGIVAEQPDTDWLVDQLYSFAPALGIAIAKAPYARLVVDLNRDPGGVSLYSDGRKETAVVPQRTFTGRDIYKQQQPDDAEREHRLATYFWPYHAAIRKRLADLRTQFPHVLLYDAHSIARLVPTIQSYPFPDIILGDAQGQAAAPTIIDAAWQVLGSSGYDVAHNQPFRGGFITRSIASPSTGIHCLQLERSHDIYLDMQSPTPKLDPEKVRQLQQRVLVPLFKGIIAALNAQNL